MCSECEKRFAIPSQAQAQGQAQAKIQVAPRPSGLSKTKAGSIQRNVSLGSKEVIAPARSVEAPPQPVQPKRDVEDLQKKRKSKGERRKKLKKRSSPPAKRYLKWIGAWIVTVAVVLLVVVKLQEAFAVNTGNLATIEQQLVGEERLFYEREYPGIRKKIMGFLAVKTVDQMAEFALDTNQLERRMTKHYKENSFRHSNLKIDPDPVYWNVAYEESPGFVEVVWEAPGSEFLEAVFVKKDKEWYLDWDHFVRYSSMNWTYFRQRVGSETIGKFRVYIEEVSSGEGSNFKPWVKVKLYPPYRERERREREESQTILLSENDPVTAKVIELFSQRSGQSKGYSELWERDQRKLRRASLELEWIEDKVSGGETLAIKDVLAGHWRSLEAGTPSAASEEEEIEATENE